MIAPEQWFQNRDRCELEVNYVPKQLEQYSNQSDSEPLTLDDADCRKFSQPLAKNYLPVQRSSEFQGMWKEVSILFRLNSPEAVQAE